MGPRRTRTILLDVGFSGGHYLSRCAIRLAVAIAMLCLPEAIVRVAHSQSPPDNSISTVVNRYCIGCHNSKVKAGNLLLDSIRHGSYRAALRGVGEGRPQAARPLHAAGRTAAARRADLRRSGRIAGRSLDAAAAAHPNPGRTDTFRRLNRTEYQNAIRDLLALDIDATSLLPERRVEPRLRQRDGRRPLADAARPLPHRRAEDQPAGRRQSPARRPAATPIRSRPTSPRRSTSTGCRSARAAALIVPYTFPQDGEYEIQRPPAARPQRARRRPRRAARAGGAARPRAGARRSPCKPPRPGNDHHAVDAHLNVRIPVTAGPHLVGATFPKKPSSLLETERQPYQAHFNMHRHPRITPALYSVSITGPYDAKGPGDTPSRRRIFVCTPTGPSEEDACAKTHPRHADAPRLPPAGHRRRPAGAAEVLSARRAPADGFDAGIEMALRAVLVSPEFLFRVEQDPPGVAPDTAYRISDLELASRLSFFLWSSIPDDELLDAGDSAASCASPAVLEQQVRRMLADPRSRSAGDQLRRPVAAPAQPGLDHARTCACSPTSTTTCARPSARRPSCFFESVLREDRSVLDLLQRELHVPERAPGQALRHSATSTAAASAASTLGADSMRGGLLRQGSILTVTSYATRTSPVIRGKWILENILGVAAAAAAARTCRR